MWQRYSYIGAFTLKQCSVFDNIIVSCQALKSICSFDIQDIDSLYTDGHALLQTALKLKHINRNPISIKVIDPCGKTAKN